MLEVLQALATLSAALFAGAALYINVAEHPARMTLETRWAAAQWAPSYQRATLLQAPLALMSLVCGSLVWALGGSIAWLIAALMIGAVVPFTFIVVMPTNRTLLDPRTDTTSEQTRALLQKWNRLHAVRTALSLGASVAYVLLLRGT